ncbi:TetR/AcrR family transcriptional regulator [Mycolicibacterium sp.]|uniref:TetR/AcrR family transcriptional regulator n=1 Tax=Mycolicibacterium sp. TaxID=2320850 RepID=UPI0037CB3DB5
MFEKESDRSVMRPTALQRRGVERMRTILDVAETLLADQGYAAATLKAIGEHAGIPTASLYHYFADREQVDAELARRHICTIDAHFAAVLENPGPDSLRGSVDALIDLFLAYFRAHPAFVQLWFVGRSPALADMADEFHAMWAERLWRFLVERELLCGDTPQFIVRFVFEMGHRPFDIAFQRCPTGDDATIDEARRMLTAYLATYAPDSGVLTVRRGGS